MPKLINKIQQQVAPKQISSTEPDKTIVGLSDEEVEKKAFEDGWVKDTHPLASKRFYRKNGEVAFDINDLRKKISP